jgi:predicted GNAT family acetyltransferase
MNPISHEEHGSRGIFFIDRGGERVAELTYQKMGDSRIVIDHTEVEPSIRGRGVARSLLDAAVAWARQTHATVGATCPYVIAQFARDASLADVKGSTGGHS